MQSLILNSGLGSRMGTLTAKKHKSMVEIQEGLSLIDHQLETLIQEGITNFIITTGYMKDKLKDYIMSRFGNQLQILFIDNPDYLSTNYIYSIYLALDYLQDDLLLLHGDLFFDKNVISSILLAEQSCVVVDSTLPLPEKDFKAEMQGGLITKIATYINNEQCLACQPLYKLFRKDWQIWAKSIRELCDKGRTNVYAEEALNTVLNIIKLKAFDVKGKICMEIDTPEDMALLKKKLLRG